MCVCVHVCGCFYKILSRRNLSLLVLLFAMQILLKVLYARNHTHTQHIYVQFYWVTLNTELCLEGHNENDE